MSLVHLPSTLALSRPLLVVAWDRCIDAVRAAFAALARYRRDVAARRVEWQQWQAVRHLSGHLLKDIDGSGRFEPRAMAGRLLDGWELSARLRGHDPF